MPSDSSFSLPPDRYFGRRSLHPLVSRDVKEPARSRCALGGLATLWNAPVILTTAVEAGLDVSFRTCLSERFSVASLIQIAGRANRHFEYPEGVIVYDFSIWPNGGLKAHPAATVSAEVLEGLLKDGALACDCDPAELVTRALRMEMSKRGVRGENRLLKAERERRYPDVAEFGRVIDADTRLVVVHRALRDRIEARDNVPTRMLLSGSVQIWTNKVVRLQLEPLRDGDELFWWPHDYDDAFLGYMKGALELEAVVRGEAGIY